MRPVAPQAVEAPASPAETDTPPFSRPPSRPRDVAHSCTSPIRVGAPPTGMAYRTTLGWSLVSSGLVTLALGALPGDPLWWGIGLVLAGVLVFTVRR